MPSDDPVVPLRHTLATLVYRAAKSLRDAPQGFSGFLAGRGSRSAGEILGHIGDLMDWALSQARGKEKWRTAPLGTWEEDCERFFAAATALDTHLASGEPLGATPERIFQGAIADSLTHVGQIALLRRLAGARVMGENYSKARIEIGRTGPAQNAAVVEFE